MTAAFDNRDKEIGLFDGRFVRDLAGERRYWIVDGDVFSLPSVSRGAEFGDRQAIRIASLIGKAAIDDNGEIVFKLQ